MEKEALAVIEALKKFKASILGIRSGSSIKLKMAMHASPGGPILWH